MLRILFVLIASCSFACYAQEDSYTDRPFTAYVGVSGGSMNCITDLGGEKKIFKTMKPAGGLYIGAMYQQAIGARLELTWGSVTAADANADEEAVRQRNFSFSSDITEISLLAELHPLALFPASRFPVSPYILAGIGSFSFNPKTNISGAEVYLQPLHTEGQGFPETGRPNYKLTQPMIPAGGGISYDLTSSLTVKGELIYRFLNTDYLDDVSTTYIDPSLFDKYLPSPLSSTAKKAAFRTGELLPNATVPVGSNRGSTANDGYYSVNIKLQLNF